MALSIAVSLLATALAIPLSSQTVISIREDSSWSLGNGFELEIFSHGIEIAQAGRTIWSAELPFISASAGNDSVVGADGAFKINNVDENRCATQTITNVQVQPWGGTTTGSAVRISGALLGCGSDSAYYDLSFWIPWSLTDRVAFYLNISPLSIEDRPLKKLYFRFSSAAGEDFYGLGAQASFGSLKNQSIPIFSREQGVGRGDEPLTSYENANGSFAGGSRFTSM